MNISKGSVNSDDKTLLLQAAAQKIRCLSNSEDVPIQEGHVTSSNTSILATELFGPILLETLSGFLFVVNEHGKVVSVTDNLNQYLGYSPSQWIEQSVYNFLHVGDHAAFSQALLPLAADKNKRGDKHTNSYRSRLLSCWLRCSQDSNTRIETIGNDLKFVPMQISCLPQFLPTDMSDHAALSSGKQLYLVCVAQRPSLPISPQMQTTHTYPTHALTLTPTPKTLSSVGSFRSSTYINISGENNSRLFPTGPEFFTTQINNSGQILNADMNSVRFKHQSSIDFTGKTMLDFVHTNDSSLFQKHIAEVKKGSPGIDYNSSIYRFKLGDSRFVFLQTKSQLLNTTQSSEDVIILSKHNIVRECDSNELKGSASSSLMNSIIQNNPPQTLIPSSNSGSLRHLSSLYQRTYNPLSSPQLPHNPYQVQSSDGSSSLPHTHRNSLPNINQPLPSPRQQFSPRQSSMTLLSGVASSRGWEFENEGWKSPSSNHISHTNTNQLPTRTRHSSGYSDKSSPIIQYQNITGSSSFSDIKLPTSLSSIGYPMPVRPDSATSQASSSGKLRDLLISNDYGMSNSNVENCVDSTSTVSTPGFSPSRRSFSVTDSVSGSNNAANNGGDDLIKRLLQEDEDDFSKPLTTTPLSSNTGSKSEVSSSDAANQASPCSQTSKTAHDHLLLKKLLTEEKEDEPPDNCKLLQKLLKTDAATDQSSVKSDSSSPASSHTSSSSSKGAKRRNASASSIKEKAGLRRNSKSREKDDLKEKIITGSVKRKAVTTEADSSSNTALLNQLLSDRQQSSNQSEVSNVSSLPSDRIKKKPKTNIIDVVDNKIIHDQGLFRMDRFTKMDFNRTRTLPSGNTPFLRTGSSMDTDTRYPEKTPLRTTLSIDMEKMTLPQPNFNTPQTLQNMYNGSNKETMKPSTGMDFEPAQPAKYFQNMSDDAHMMAMIESIISDTGDPAGHNQVQTIEDQLAIRDIEQQLLSLDSQNPIQRIPSQANMPLSPHDPLNFEPAMASNPAHSNAMYLIDHRPPFNRSQPQHGYSPTSTPQPANIRMQAAAMRGTGRGRRGNNMNSRAANSNLGGNTRTRSFPEGSSYNTQGNNNFNGFPRNFGELMKSSAPPPNMELPMDMPTSSYDSTCSGNSMSPLNTRVTNAFSAASPDVSTSSQYPQYLELQTPFSGTPTPHSNQPPPGQQRVQRQTSATHRYNIQDSPFANLPIPDQSMSVNLNNNMDYQQFQNTDPNPKMSPGGSAQSEYIRQGIRNVCAARAQQLPVTSPTQGMMPHMMSQPSQQEEGIEMATKELPDYILEQISALASEREEMQKSSSVQISNPGDHPRMMSPLMSMAGPEMMSNGPVVSSDDIALSKINQSKQEAEHMREQLRALAHSSFSAGMVDSGANLFRAQLAGSKSKKSQISPNDHHRIDVNRLKMNVSSQSINIISAPDPRPSVADMRPNDNRDSILQALLTHD